MFCYRHQYFTINSHTIITNTSDTSTNFCELHFQSFLCNFFFPNEMMHFAKTNFIVRLTLFVRRNFSLRQMLTRKEVKMQPKAKKAEI